jgi:putative DNA primase/helicase
MTDPKVVSIDTAKKLRGGRDFVTVELFGEVINHITCEERKNVGNLIAYDKFKRCVVCRGKPPWRNGEPGRWSDIHDHMLHAWLSTGAGGKLKVTLSTVQEAVQVIAQMNAFHPVDEYLDSLPGWDGAPRIDTWLTECFGAPNTRLTRAYAAKTLIAAVARIRQPGCKVDTVLVLESKQGKRKSATLKALVPDERWFLDSRIDISNKDAYQVTQGRWIIEFPELDSLRGKEKTLVRAWLSSAVDVYRPSHAQHVVEQPRQYIVIGTTNEDEYLDDTERRIWSVRCESRSNTEWVEQNREQIWAEALCRYDNGEPWWLDEELDTLARESTGQRIRVDASEGLVRDWMQQCGRELDGVTTAEVLIGALGYQKDRISSGTKMITQVLRKLGYEHDKTMKTRRMTVHLPAKKDRFWRNVTALQRCEHGKVISEPCIKCELGLGDND